MIDHAKPLPPLNAGESGDWQETIDPKAEAFGLLAEFYALGLSGTTESHARRSEILARLSVLRERDSES